MLEEGKKAKKAKVSGKADGKETDEKEIMTEVEEMEVEEKCREMEEDADFND